MLVLHPQLVVTESVSLILNQFACPCHCPDSSVSMFILTEVPRVRESWLLTSYFLLQSSVCFHTQGFLQAPPAPHPPPRILEYLSAGEDTGCWSYEK